MHASLRSRWTRTAVVLSAVAMLAAACGGNGNDNEAASETGSPEATSAPTSEASSPAAAEQATGEPITVGIITGTSGLLKPYGEAYVAGLKAGLDYATDGTDAVNGRPIEYQYVDTAGEPDKAISAATDLVGKGVKIIAGTVSSGVAVQVAPFAEENSVLYISGPAATDAITGINKHTFRSGRQTYQDVATAATLLDNVEGSNVLVLAQDSAFGQGNVAAVQSVLGDKGANVDSILVPLKTTEFTPFAQQVIDKKPDLLFVAWAGETTAAMWQALQQQGVFDATTVTTGLGDVASYSAYPGDPSGIKFLSHYVPGTLDNPVDTYMESHVDQPDLFTPDGFVASQMIVHALTEAGPDDVDGMINALEGWTFDAPKGQQTIRASDHAMLQPMFTAKLSGEQGNRQATLLNTLDPQQVAPPESSGS